jgi:hypothetical protein
MSSPRRRIETDVSAFRWFLDSGTLTGELLSAGHEVSNSSSVVTGEIALLTSLL